MQYNMTEKLSLDSLRDGEEFTVEELRFGAMKRVYAGGMDDQFALLDKMVTETLKIAFPDITADEIDNIKMTDMKPLSDAIATANGADLGNFTPPKTTK